MGAVSEGIAGGLMMVIWQPNHRGFSASHWHPGTSVADDARRLDCVKSLLGVQISIPGSDSVRSPWCMGVLRQFRTKSQRPVRRLGGFFPADEAKGIGFQLEQAP